MTRPAAMAATDAIDQVPAESSTIDAVGDRRFSQAQCAALFEAVLIDDDVDAHTELPERITLDFDQALLLDCYGLCRQLWLSGVERGDLIRLNVVLLRDRDLDPFDRLQFKHVRAKFKHLRFAHALYGKGHDYPMLLDWLTTLLGQLQDAFKTKQAGTVWRRAMLCRLFLARGSWRLLRNELDRLQPTTSAGFREYMARQVTTLEGVLAQDLLTGAQFHATRKIASRLVSFYDTLRTISPSEQAYKMSRYLAAINGLMGTMHDDLVERRIAGLQDYHSHPFALPHEIRERLTKLVARFRIAGL